MGVLAFVLSCAIGLAWGVAYRLPNEAFAVWMAAHAVIGLTLAVVLPPLARRVCPRSPRAGSSLAVVLALGAAPAFLDRLSFVDLPGVVRLGAFGLAGLLVIALGLAVGRTGAVMSTIAGVCALAAASLSTAASTRLLPPRPVETPVRQPAAVKRLAVLGIDGADWRVIDPMIERGELPNLAALRSRGVHGVLESIEPMYSPVVWSSIFSGKVPEKHGITGWYVSHAANARAVRLWRLLEVAGLRSVVSNVPGTWPPRELDGALVSGFPMPSPYEFAGGESLLVGTVVDEHAREGEVPTARATAAPDGSASARVHLGDEAIESQVRLRHGVLEWPKLRQLLPGRAVMLPVSLGEAKVDGTREVRLDDSASMLRPGEWTPWSTFASGGTPVRVRARLLADGSVYVTPAFQDPGDPRHWFTSSPRVLEIVAAGGTYVVEGAGWRAAADVRDALFEHLEDVAGQSYDALLRLVAEVPDWTLLAYVFTLPDRVSHGYWRFHQPEEYPALDAAELAASRSRVEDSYRWVDAHLGELLAKIGDDVTVLVVSDHGFRADTDGVSGGHRKEGIFIAAGPGVVPTAESRTWSVLDVTPTALALFGLPVADDMDGRPRVEDFSGVAPVTRIATYERESTAPATGAADDVRIDATTEEQLRSLGYVE